MQVPLSALCRARRPQGHRGGLRALRLAARPSRGPQLRDHDPRVAGPGRMARRRTAARTWRWRRPASTGSRSGIVLEGSFELVLANAQHVRNVPGRKTDVNDAAWIADLLAHGLIRSSFVPPAPIQELRDLTRTRKQLVREIAQHSLRIQKVLEDANLKLGSVLSDVLGRSGRAMLEAIIAGEDDPEALAELAQGTARARRAGPGRGAARPRHAASPGHAQAAPGSGRRPRARARRGRSPRGKSAWRRSGRAPAC